MTGNKTVFTIAAVAILAPVIVQVQAASIPVPNGTFHMYKPGTTIRSTSASGDIWVQHIGTNRPISGGTVTFEDSTTLTKDDLVDIPGWTTPIETTNHADLYSLGYEGDGSKDADLQVVGTEREGERGKEPAGGDTEEAEGSHSLQREPAQAPG